MPNYAGLARKIVSLPVLVFLSPLTFNFFLINSTWTPTQGWYFEWGQYIANGNVPYRDFYIPFPPLFAYVNRLFLFAPDPFLTERIFMAFLFSFLVLGMFRMLSRFFPQHIAFISSLIASLVFQFSPTNTIAGYYEFALALTSWGLYLCLSVKWKSRFLGGMLIVAASLTKQNFILLVLIVVAFEFYKSIVRRGVDFRKISILCGVITTYSLFTVYLIINGTFISFIENMLQGGGKSPSLILLAKNLLAPSLNAWNLFFVLIILVMMYLKQSLTLSDFANLKLLYSFLITFIVLGLFISESQKWVFEKRITIFCFVIIWSLLYYNLKKPLLDLKIWNFRTLTLIVCLSPSLAFLINEFVGRKFPDRFKVFATLNNYSVVLGNEAAGFLLGLLCIFLILFILSYFVPKIQRIFLECIGERNNESDLPLKFQFVIVGLFLSGIVNAFNGGFDFSANVILGAIAIAFFISFFRNQFRSQLLTIGTVLFFCLSSIQIGLYNYQWFGWNESNSLHPIIQKSQIPQFRNFYLTQTQITFYQEVQDGISAARDILEGHSNNIPKIVTFPMQPVINEISGLPRYKLNCPILHFDICPDNQAQIDLKSFKRVSPDLVVLFDLGVDFVIANEKTWRSGNVSVYSKIQNYFLYSGRYEVVRKIPPNSSNLSTVYILALKKDG